MPSSALSYKRLLSGGAGAYLAGLGLATWDQFGTGAAYTAASPWPVYLGPNMPSSPDRIIVITPGVQSFVRADVETTIQIRLRGAVDDTADDVENQAQAIHDAFYPNGFPLGHVSFGGVLIGAVIPGDTLPLDPDANRRHGSIQNFRIRGRRP